MVMRTFLATLLFPIFFVSCATKVTPPVPIPQAPPITVSAKPPLEKTQQNIDHATDENTKIGKDIKDQKDSILGQKMDIIEALSQAKKMEDKLIAKQQITQIEMANLVTQLKKVEVRNLFLENKNTELESTTAKQKDLLDTAKKNAADTLQKVNDKENEASELRRQNTFIGDNLNVKNKEVIALQQEREKLNKKLADAAVYKKWAFGLLIGAILIFVIKTAITVYKPFG